MFMIDIKKIESKEIACNKNNYSDKCGSYLNLGSIQIAFHIFVFLMFSDKLNGLNGSFSFI